MRAHGSYSPLRGFAVVLLASALAATLAVSCSTVQSALRAPGAIVRQLTPGGPPAKIDVDAISLRLMRFADVSALRITKATEAFAEKAGTPEARIQALSWQIDYNRGLWRLASGPQPYEGLFSSIVMITVLRRNHDMHFLAEWGDADRAVVDALAQIDRDGWALAETFVVKSEIDKARAIVARWLERTAATGSTDAAELPAFGEIVRAEGENPESGALLGLITLDPLSGLEPAVAEVEQSRRLAERTLYYFQHLPTLLSAQVELTGLRSARVPEIQRALADWQRFSAATDSLAATAGGLPDRLAVEREALLGQLGREITAQREGLLHDLETAREPLNEILRQTQGTAESGREMSLATTEALQAGVALSRAIDEMVASLRNGGGGAVAAGETGPPGRKFDITEYTAAADSISRSAQALTETISTLDRSLPQLKLAVQEALAQGDRTVDRAFRRALQFLVVALLGGAITVLVVRRITLRWSNRTGPPAGS